MRDGSLDSLRKAYPYPFPDRPSKRVFLDDLSIAKVEPPVVEPHDQRSIENNTNFHRKREAKGTQNEKEFQSIRLSSKDGKILEVIQAKDFYEQSNFFIDTLKQDFCEEKPDGWFQFKTPMLAHHIEEELLPVDVDQLFYSPTSPPRQPTQEQQAKRTGRWSNDEHDRFLQALKLFGKDWELIEKHIGTRGIDNIRSHAQKFLARLLKYMEGESAIENMSLEEAQFYYGVLNIRLHKTIKMNKLKKEREEAKKREAQRLKEERARNPPQKPVQQIFKIEKALPLVPQSPQIPDTVKYLSNSENKHMQNQKRCRFDLWKETESSFKQPSTMSVSSSVRIRQEAIKKNGDRYFKFSFRSVFQKPQEELGDADSTGSAHLIRFNVDTEDLPSVKDENKFSRLYQLKTAFQNLIDIDSDDEVPDLRICLEDYGFEQNMLKGLTSATYMKVFHQMHLGGTGRNLPNLYNLTMKRINGHIEKENQDSGEKPKPLMRMGPFTVQPGADVRVDLNRAREYFMRPPEQQVTRLAFKYFPKKAGRPPRVSADVQETYIPVPMTKEDLKTLEDLKNYGDTESNLDSCSMDWTTS